MVIWNDLTVIISFALDCLILINVSLEYYRLKLPNIKYFLGAFLLFVLSEFAGIIQIIAKGENLGDLILISNTSLSFTLLGTLCIVLFFETFRSESPLTRGNIIFSLIVVINAVSLILIGIITKSFLIGENTDVSVFPARFLLTISEGLSLIFYFLTLIEFMLMFIKIHQRIQMSKTTSFISTLKQMRIGVILITSSFILSFLFDILSDEGTIWDVVHYFLNLVTLAGFFWIFWVYLKKGIFVLQAEEMRRLLIVDTGGVPIYSYVFSQFEKTRIQPSPQELPPENALTEENLTEEVIFSGALKAISTLFTELTGAQQTIKEIILDRTILLIQQSPNKEYIVVLFADRSTRFYRDALSRFTTALFSNLQEIVPNQRFSEMNERIAEKYIQEFFGFRKPPKIVLNEDSVTNTQVS